MAKRAAREGVLWKSDSGLAAFTCTMTGLRNNFAMATNGNFRSKLISPADAHAPTALMESSLQPVHSLSAQPRSLKMDRRRHTF
jgi:hypothetical protein